jgi:hypothetical protein
MPARTVSAVVAVVILVAVLSVQCSVWRECRAEHSFFYCMSLVSR